MTIESNRRSFMKSVAGLACFFGFGRLVDASPADDVVASVPCPLPATCARVVSRPPATLEPKNYLIAQMNVISTRTKERWENQTVILCRNQGDITLADWNAATLVYCEKGSGPGYRPCKWTLSPAPLIWKVCYGIHPSSSIYLEFKECSFDREVYYGMYPENAGVWYRMYPEKSAVIERVWYRKKVDVSE